VNKSAATCYPSDSAPIATLDTEIISTPGRIWRRSRTAQVICVPSTRDSEIRGLITVFRSLGGVETCGGGDFALRPVTTGPVTGGFEAGWNFIWGDFAAAVRHEPNQPTSTFRIAAFVSGVGNGELYPSPLPHSRSPSRQATHKRKSRASDQAFVLWRPAISPTPRQSQLHARASWPRNAWKRSGPRSGLGQRNDNHPGDL
jgi:hypothetical protein